MSLHNPSLTSLIKYYKLILEKYSSIFLLHEGEIILHESIFSQSFFLGWHCFGSLFRILWNEDIGRLNYFFLSIHDLNVEWYIDRCHMKSLSFRDLSLDCSNYEWSIRSNWWAFVIITFPFSSTDVAELVATSTGHMITSLDSFNNE